MILQPHLNTAVAAPQFSDMIAALEVYRSYMGEPLLGMSDFVAFATSPSPERDEFLALMAVEYRGVNNLYVKQIYSVIN